MREFSKDINIPAINKIKHSNDSISHFGLNKKKQDNNVREINCKYYRKVKIYLKIYFKMVKLLRNRSR